MAKGICAVCPVQVACLGYAIRTKPARGIWAGATADEIAELAAFRRQREQGVGDVCQEVA